MKTRQGFVSNSSSTSFLLVAYRAKAKEMKPADYRPLCEEKFNRKDILKFAVDYRMIDDKWSLDDFNGYPDLLWKELWERTEEVDDNGQAALTGRAPMLDVPAGLKSFSEWMYGDPYVGLEVETGYECTICVDVAKVFSTIEKVKKLAPAGAKIEVLAGEHEN